LDTGDALYTYKHDSHPEDILEAIRSIYENLSNENLLKRYLVLFGWIYSN